MARFEKQVDPTGRLDPQERRTRAEHARKAYFLSLSLRASQTRRARRAAVSSHAAS